MRKIMLLFSLITIASGLCHSQTKEPIDSFVYKYRIDTLYSDTLHQNRIIKIYLPAGFKKELKYPIFYVLDEDWMFEPAVAEVVQLSNSNVIPASVVIGIHSENRMKDLRLSLDGEFTETSGKFQFFLTNELQNYIAKNYTVPVFNILVGHSDGATYSQKILTAYNQPFRGVISLSQNLVGMQLEDFLIFSKRLFQNNIYYFVASGTRDATSRLKSGCKLDSIFRLNSNKNLKLMQVLYAADHGGVAVRGLNDGISFVFSDYFQNNDWNQALIDSLTKLKADPIQIIQAEINRIQNIYGLDILPSREGILSLAFAISTDKDQLEKYFKYKTNLLGKDENSYASFAQGYERINAFEDALKYWKLNLSENYEHNNVFFYYMRPIELMAFKMNKSQEAINFAEEWQKKKPDLTLQFNYIIAKICSGKNIEKKKGLTAIQFCLDNYKTNGLFKLGDANKIRDALKN